VIEACGADPDPADIEAALAGGHVAVVEAAALADFAALRTPLLQCEQRVTRAEPDLAVLVIIGDKEGVDSADPLVWFVDDRRSSPPRSKWPAGIRSVIG
jgi:hypothetical protein